MELSPGYSVEIDNIDKKSWHTLIQKFDDANIYQTWSYEAVKSGENRLSHILLKRKGEVVAAAQVRILKAPLLNVGAAYVRWGPLWRLRDRPSDPEVFSQAIRALHNEYARRRRLYLKVLPILFDDQADIFNPVLASEGFVHPSVEVPQKTILVGLDGSEEELRKGLHEKWRYNLKLAEKNNLRVVEGFDDELFGLFIDIYKQTHERKKFLETSDVSQFRKMQQDLPESLKMKVWVAFTDDKPAAGVICSGIGSMGLFLFGGTSDAGLNTRGSYVLQWKALNWLREQGAACYNLAGINPVRNPGTYRFKSGLCGRNGKEVMSLGTYDVCAGVISHNVFQLANFARVMNKRGKTALNGLLTRFA